MIVRVWEAQVIPSRADAFCAALLGGPLPDIRSVDGCIGAELLRSVGDGDHRVMVVTRWQDEAALRAYAGPMWKIRPVWAEGELGYLEHPPSVSHFVPIAQEVTAG